MKQATTRSKSSQIQWNSDGSVHLNSSLVSQWDLVKQGPSSYHCIYNNRSFSIEVVHLNKEAKTLDLIINGIAGTVSIEDETDLLLKSLGLDHMKSSKQLQLKAPMPGLIVHLLIEEGQTVEEGSPTMVLEAMKMENEIKSPVSGTVKKIHVQQGKTVDKNQLLIEFA